jgi:hypothetical protein
MDIPVVNNFFSINSSDTGLKSSAIPGYFILFNGSQDHFLQNNLRYNFCADSIMD